MTDIDIVREALRKRQKGTGSTKNIEPALAALDRIEADLAREDAAVEAAKRVDHLIWFDVRVAGQEAVEAQHALHSALAALEGEPELYMGAGGATFTTEGEKP